MVFVEKRTTAVDPDSIPERIRIAAELSRTAYTHSVPYNVGDLPPEAKGYARGQSELIVKDPAGRVIVEMSATLSGELVRFEREFAQPGSGFEDRKVWERTVAHNGSRNRGTLVAIQVWDYRVSSDAVIEEITGSYHLAENGALVPYEVSEAWTPVEEPAALPAE